jgi:predicted DCC family thiol-disulfide oxidoreductase YuxK
MKDKAILYDHNCPMCALYTKGFVKWQLLDKENRISFAQLDNQIFIERVDWYRARHEIPLVDLQGGQTLYGLESCTTWYPTTAESSFRKQVLCPLSSTAPRIFTLLTV